MTNKKIAVFGIYPHEYYLCEVFTLDEKQNIAAAADLLCPYQTLIFADGKLSTSEGECFDFLVLDLEEIEVIDAA